MTEEKEKIMENFVDSIRTICEERDINIRAFARRIGVSSERIYHYTGFQTTPTVEVLVRISNKYKVSVDWLLGLSDKR